MNHLASELPNQTDHVQAVDPSPPRSSVIRTRVIPAIALSMVVGLLGLLAYSLFAPDDARLDQPGRVNASGALITENGRQAPDFTIETFDGERFQLSEQRGKIVVVNFWASWCDPCREETPLLVTADGHLGPDVILVGVDIWDTDSAARDFLSSYQVTYPNGRDEGGDILIDYGVTGVPETFVIDRDGRIIARLPGPITRLEQLQSMVAEAQ